MSDLKNDLKDAYVNDFFNEIIEYIKSNKPNKQKLANYKIILCKKHKLGKIPTDIEILLRAEPPDIGFLKKYLVTKPIRTISGVAIIAIMTKPFKCPHGACAQCPGGLQSAFGDVPQSYTGHEPATMRAIRNGYDSYLQVFNRLEQYVVLGQNPDKAELIIMGGTFPSFPEEYQDEFVYYAFKAMNDFSNLFYNKGELNILRFKEFFGLPGKVGDEKRTIRIHSQLLNLRKKGVKSLIAEQKENEKSAARCVGLTIETRPDYALLKHANKMLSLGCTRVELGVQSIYDDALARINRGHDVAESIKATRTLKDLGFKINYHMMLGMPGVNYIQDIEGLKQLFDNQKFRPDMLKLYPCMVLKGTALHSDWLAGRFKPLSTEQAVRLIIDFKKHVPEYVRIMRVQRDIPTSMIEAGVDRTNLRQLIEERMSEQKLKCNCIRCREIKAQKITGKVKLKTIEYQASEGKEFFISIECNQSNNTSNPNKTNNSSNTNSSLIGFCRLRLPSQSLRKEISKDSALIRELHVYGSAAKIGSSGKIQHHGFGKRLLLEAEKIAKKSGKKKIVIISGVGVRDYYRHQGYKKQGPYMIKKI